MKLIPFNYETANTDYQNYNPQYGGMNVYAGTQYQKGHGIGNILSGLFRSAVPLLKKGVSSLGKTALQTGLNVVKDTIEGQNVKASLKRNLKKAGHEVLTKAIKKTSQYPQNFHTNQVPKSQSYKKPQHKLKSVTTFKKSQKGKKKQ